jgi:protein-S-isoprenylcysteine O-methyltransferase Ste14
MERFASDRVGSRMPHRRHRRASHFYKSLQSQLYYIFCFTITYHIIMVMAQRVDSAAHVASILKTSEFLGIVLLVSSFILQRVFPPSRTFIPAAGVSNSFGTVLILIGIKILRWTHAELDREGQPHAPGVPTTKLVTTGPFHWSRNPTYATIVILIVPAVAMLLRNPWVFRLWPASVVAHHMVLIREEEEYLQSKFPKEWADYSAKTRRWI